MVFSGGLHRDLATIKDGEQIERHHLPCFGAYDGIVHLDRGNGICIEMLKVDHRKLDTTSKPEVGEHIRNIQTAFIRNNAYHLAFLKGIEEVVDTCGTKYNRAIVQAEGELLKVAVEKVQELQQARAAHAIATAVKDLKAQAELERKIEQLGPMQLNEQYRAAAEKRLAREAEIVQLEKREADLQARLKAGTLSRDNYECLSQGVSNERQELERQQAASLGRAISTMKSVEQSVSFQAEIARAELHRSNVRSSRQMQQQQVQSSRQVDRIDFASISANKSLERRVAEFQMEMKAYEKHLPQSERVLWTGSPPEKIEPARLLIEQIKARLDGIAPAVKQLESDLVNARLRDPTVENNFKSAKEQYEANSSLIRTMKSIYTEDFFVAQRACLDQSLDQSQSFRLHF